MSQLYARVFLQILDSSIAEDFTARHVFEDFLKLSEDGIVDMTRQALSRRINCPMAVLNDSIAKLEAADLASRDQEFEGRRIERLDDHRDWGWRILNWEKYEELRTRADVAIRVARHRKNKKENGGGKKDEPEVNGSYHLHSRVALAWLNEKSGHHYRETEPNLKVISARLSEEGVTIEGVKLMIERQVARWHGTDMSNYLRPETLFGKQKFDGYYAAKDQPVLPKVSAANGPVVKPLSVMDLNTILKAKQTEADELKKKHSSEAAMGAMWNDEPAKKRFVELRKEIRELNSKIGRMA